MPAPLIDTHCHLDAAEFDGDRNAVAEAAHRAGVAAIVVPAVELANFPAVRDCCIREPGCLAAYGLHPMYLARHRPEHIAELRVWVERERPPAVGEIGLDLFVRGLDYATQESYYVEQLKVARDFELPVLLHVRRANDQILKHLRRFGITRGIAHAFNGSPHQAREFLKLGFKLGFGGAVTYSRATRLQRLARELPREALVLETDAPDIPPTWIAKGRNTPEELPRIAEVIARLWDCDSAEVARQTTANACAVLNLPADGGAAL